MADRAGLFEDADEIDISGFTPKKPAAQPPAEAVRAVSEGAQFKSREPIEPSQKIDRRHRTGRSEQLNIKVTRNAKEMLYSITESQGWVQGYTLERALQALQRELDRDNARN